MVENLTETQTGRSSPSRFAVDFFLAILIIAVVAAVPVIFTYLWMLPNNLVYYENYLFYMSLPISIELAAAYVLARGYLVQGQARILAFGSASFILGLVGVTEIYFGFFESSLGPSLAAASIGGLLFSALNLYGAFQFRRRASSGSSGWRERLAVAYVAGGVGVALVSYFALNGLGPAFYGPPGVGMYNLVYEAFSASSMIILLASSILLFAGGSEDPGARFVTWYAAGLVLTALLYVPFFLSLPYSAGFTFLQGSTNIAAGACALIFAFFYLQKTRLNNVPHMP
jgi:hypothetical protein